MKVTKFGGSSMADAGQYRKTFFNVYYRIFTNI